MRFQTKCNQYDKIFKSEAVKLALSGELRDAEIDRDFGGKLQGFNQLDYATMSNPKPDKPSNTSKPSKLEYQALERQLRATHKELDLRKRKIDFLKNKRVFCEPETAKYACIQTYQGLTIATMGVSRSGFYDWRISGLSNLWTEVRYER